MGPERQTAPQTCGLNGSRATDCAANLWVEWVPSYCPQRIPASQRRIGTTLLIPRSALPIGLVVRDQQNLLEWLSPLITHRETAL
jgi:hypothetical protein